MLDRYFYTFHNPAGSRFVRGAGGFPNVTTVDVPLRGQPAWAVGYAMETAIWHIVLANGDLQVVEVALDGEARTLAHQPLWFNGAQPPLVGVSMVEGTYILRSDESVSPWTHPIPVNDFETLHIDRAGALVLGREGGVLARLPVNAKPDARLVMNSRGQVALYANAALLALEARESQLRVLARVDLPGEDVYAGIAPFWADIDGDGSEDLVATVSNASIGARLRAYLWSGRGIRQEIDSPPAGSSSGNLHQLGAADFTGSGQTEIAAMNAARDGGRLDFFRYAGDALVKSAELRGFTTGSSGSRNFDQTALGDFDGDGAPEVLVMDPARRSVVAVKRNGAGAEASWRLDAGGEIISNFAPVELLDGGLALAVGTSDSRLRVWLPQ